MGIFDSILLIILTGFVFYGLFFGLIRTVGSLLGIVLGFFAANMFYLPLFNVSQGLMFGFERTGKIICFLLIFTIVNRLVCFLFALLNKGLDVISIIPFVKTLNRLAGAVLGLIEGSIILGLIFFYLGEYNLLMQKHSEIIAGSKIAPYAIKFSQTFLDILPSLIDKVKAYM